MSAVVCTAALTTIFVLMLADGGLDQGDKIASVASMVIAGISLPVDVTPWRRRAWAFGKRFGPLVKWVTTALASVLIGAYISDIYTDRQRENEIEAQLITDISHAAVALFQDAQDAARATTDPNQRQLRDQAADQWVLESSELTALFQVYYADTPVLAHWGEYQAAMYQWSVLGCCTTDEGHPSVIELIRTYLTTHGLKEPERPVHDPWTELTNNASPNPKTYQWLGFYLLKGRGALLRELKAATPNLD